MRLLDVLLEADGENQVAKLCQDAANSKAFLKKFLSPIQDRLEIYQEEDKKIVLDSMKESLDEMAHTISRWDFDDKEKMLATKFCLSNITELTNVFTGKRDVRVVAMNSRDLQSVLRQIESFFRVKRFCDEKNLLNIKPWDELESVIRGGERTKRQWEEGEKQKEEKAKLFRQINAKSKIHELGEIEGFKVYIPLNMEGACKLGDHTKWCTASTEGGFKNNYFNSYDEDGDLIVCVDLKTGEKYQIHTSSNSMMNALNEPVNYDHSETTRRLHKVQEKVESFYDKRSLIPKNVKVPEDHEKMLGKISISPTGRVRETGSHEWFFDEKDGDGRESLNANEFGDDEPEIWNSPARIKKARLAKAQRLKDSKVEYGPIINKDHSFRHPESIDDEVPNANDVAGMLKVPTSHDDRRSLDYRKIWKKQSELKDQLKRMRQYEKDYEHLYESILAFLGINLKG